MTKTPTPASEAPPRTHAPVDPLPMTNPIWIAVYQTTTCNVWETFTGPGARHRAHEWADATAQSTGRVVAVFGPQDVVFGPTPPVVPKATVLMMTEEAVEQ